MKAFYHRIGIYARLRILVFLILTANIAVGCNSSIISEGMLSPSPDRSIKGVNHSTPEEAVLSFYEAMDSSDVEMMNALIDSSDESSILFVEGFAKGTEQGIFAKINDIEIFTIEKTEKMARLRSHYFQSIYANNELVSEGLNGGWFTLIEKDAKWYFIGLADPVPPGWILDK
ncbi:MAG: hypothetical protein GY746_04390 [Gammaproteobacteria bacterium]|nr:hypothetical protein [Gammaproteobacteria bacterium]